MQVIEVRQTYTDYISIIIIFQINLQFQFGMIF